MNENVEVLAARACSGLQDRLQRHSQGHQPRAIADGIACRVNRSSLSSSASNCSTAREGAAARARHEAIARAIADSDVETTGKWMERHITDFRKGYEFGRI
jgi:DNA-binding GntR family transcriptional regulator